MSQPDIDLAKPSILDQLIANGGGGGGGGTPTGTAGTPNAAVVSVQGVSGGTAVPVSLSGNISQETGGNLATIATAQGAGATGVTQLTGGSGLLGWLSGIFQKLSNALSINSIVAPGTLLTSQWSNATASATQILAARTGAAGTGRVSLNLYNAGSNTVFYGPSGVTTANGSRLLPGGSRTLYTTSAIFGVPASGTGNLDVDEVF
jgi:hypothetical protein